MRCMCKPIISHSSTTGPTSRAHHLMGAFFPRTELNERHVELLLFVLPWRVRRFVLDSTSLARGRRRTPGAGARRKRVVKARDLEGKYRSADLNQIVVFRTSKFYKALSIALGKTKKHERRGAALEVEVVGPNDTAATKQRRQGRCVVLTKH